MNTVPTVGGLSGSAALDTCFMEQEWHSISLLSARQAAASLKSKVQREVSSFPTEQYADTWQRLLQGQGQQGTCKLTLEAKYRCMTLLLARLHVLDTQPSSQQDVRRSRPDQGSPCIPWYHLRCLEQQQIRSSVTFSCCEVLQSLLLFILECLDTQEALIETSSPKRREQRSKIGTRAKKHAATDMAGRMFLCHHAMQPSAESTQLQLTNDACLLALPYAMHLLGHAVACTRELYFQPHEQVAVVPDVCRATSEMICVNGDKDEHEPPLTAVSNPCTDDIASELQPAPSGPLPRETAQNSQPAQPATLQNYDVPAAVWQQAAHHLWLRPVVHGVADVPVYLPAVLHMHSAQQGWGSWASTMWRISPPAACTQALWGVAAWQQVEARYVFSAIAAASASQEYAGLMRQLKALRAKVARVDSNSNDLQADHSMHQSPSYQALAKEASQLSMTALSQLDAWTHSILSLDAWRQLQRTYSAQQSTTDQHPGKHRLHRPSNTTVNNQNLDQSCIQPSTRNAFTSDDLAAVLELSSYVIGIKCAFHEAAAWLAPLQHFAASDIVQQLTRNDVMSKCINNQGMWGDALALGMTNPSANGTDKQDAASDDVGTEPDLTNGEVHDQVEDDDRRAARRAKWAQQSRGHPEAVNQTTTAANPPTRGSLLWSRARHALINHLDPAPTEGDTTNNGANRAQAGEGGAEWGRNSGPSTSSAFDDGASWSGDEALSNNMHINTAACDNDCDSFAAEDSATALPQRDDTFHDPAAAHAHRTTLQRISEANRPSHSGSEHTSTLAARIDEHRSVSQQGHELGSMVDDMAAMQYDTPAWAYEAKLSESGITPDMEGDAAWPKGRPWNLASSDFGRPLAEGLDSDAANSSVASLPVSPTMHTGADTCMQAAATTNAPAAPKAKQGMKGLFKRWLPSGSNKNPKPKPQPQQQLRISVEDLGGVITQDDTDQLTDEDEAPTQEAEVPEQDTQQAENCTVHTKQDKVDEDEQPSSENQQQPTLQGKGKPKRSGLFSKMARNVLGGRKKAAPSVPALGHASSFNSHLHNATQQKPQGLIRFVSLRPNHTPVDDFTHNDSVLVSQQPEETAAADIAGMDNEQQLPMQNNDGMGHQACVLAAEEPVDEQPAELQNRHSNQRTVTGKENAIAAVDEIQQALEAIARTQAEAARYVNEAHISDISAANASGCSNAQHSETSEIKPDSLPPAADEHNPQCIPALKDECVMSEVQGSAIDNAQTSTKPVSIQAQNTSGEKPASGVAIVNTVDNSVNPWTAAVGLSDNQQAMLPFSATEQQRETAQHTLPQPNPDSKGPLAQAMLTRMRSFLTRKQQANDETVLQSPSARPSFALLPHMRQPAQDVTTEAELEYQELSKEADTNAENMANDRSQRGNHAGLERLYMQGRNDAQVEQEVRSTPGQGMALDSTRRVPSPSAWARRWRSQVSARAVAAALAAVDAPQRIPRPARHLQQTGRSIAKAAAVASILEKQSRVKQIARQVIAEAASQAGKVPSKLVTLVRELATELHQLASCVEMYTKPNSFLSKTATTEWSKLLPDVRNLQQLCNSFLGNSSMAQLMFTFPDAIEKLGDLSALTLSTANIKEAEHIHTSVRTTNESSAIPRCSNYSNATYLLAQPACERGIGVEDDRPAQDMLEGTSAGGGGDAIPVPSSDEAMLLGRLDSQQLPNLPAIRTASHVPSRPTPFLNSNVLQGDHPHPCPPAAIHGHVAKVHNHGVANPSQALIQSIDTSVIWSLCQYSVRLINLRQLPAAVCFTPLSILTDVQVAESRLRSTVTAHSEVDNNAGEVCGESHRVTNTSDEPLPAVAGNTPGHQQTGNASVDSNTSCIQLQVLQEEAEAIISVVESHHNPLDLSWLVNGFELCNHASQLLSTEVPHIPTWQTVWQLTNSHASSPARASVEGKEDVGGVIESLTNRVAELRELANAHKQDDRSTTRLLHALAGPDGMHTIQGWYVELRSGTLRPTPDASSHDSRPLGPLAKAACDKAARQLAGSTASGGDGSRAAAVSKGIFTHFISTAQGHTQLAADHYIALSRMNGAATLQTVAQAIRAEATNLLKAELMQLLEQMMSLACSEVQQQAQPQPNRQSGPGNHYPGRETVEIWNVQQSVGGANQLISDSIKRHQSVPQPIWDSLLGAIAKLGNLATAAGVLDAALLRQKVQQGLWSAAHLGMAVDMENGCFVPTEFSAPAAIRNRILGHHLPTFHTGNNQAHTRSAAHLVCDHLAVAAWYDMQPEAWLPSFLSNLSSSMDAASDPSTQQAATSQNAQGDQWQGQMSKEQVAKACGEVVLQLALRRMLASDAPMRSSKTSSPTYGQGSVLQGTALLLALTGLPQNHPVHSQLVAIMKTAQQEVATHHANTPACHWAKNQHSHAQNVASVIHPVSISQPAGQIHAFIQSAGGVLKDWAVACMYARCMVTNVQACDDKAALQSAKAHVHIIDNNEGSIQLGTVQAAVAAKLLPLTNRDVKKRNAAWGYKDHWADRAVALTASLDVQASMSDTGVRDQQLEAMQRVAMAT